MKYVQLGRTDLEVSQICLGTWLYGGWWWGEVDDKASIGAIRAAREGGINFFDTADVYGGGRAECLLGEALEGDDEAIIATKGGCCFDENFYTHVTNDPAHLKKACEDSLVRLKRDAIDLYQLHWPEEGTSVVDAVEALRELQEEGKIRYFGLSNFGVDALETALDTARYESIQPEYNLLHRDAEAEILPFCEDNEIGVIVYSPLARGLLTGKFESGWEFGPGDTRAEDPEFIGERFERNLEIVELLKDYAEQRDCTPTQLSLAWILAHTEVTCAIVGARLDMQIDESVEAIDYPLTLKEVEEINALVEHMRL